MMITKTCKVYSTRGRADGRLKTYEFDKKYTVNNANGIPDDKREEILKLHKLGVPATRISREVGISTERIRRLIKKANQQANEAKKE